MSARLPRRALLALPALAGCAGLPPPPEGVEPGALAVLERTARAMGLGDPRPDLAVSYDGEWPPLVHRLQPALVDRGYRRRSEERILFAEGLIAQAHEGPAGRKHVLRAPGRVRVWYDGAETGEAEALDAAALVADAYGLFLLGPAWLLSRAPLAALSRAGAETIAVGGRRHRCEVLRAVVAPGLGASLSERLVLWLDPEEGATRRARFGLEGLASTRGAVAEVDAWGHVRREGVLWPTLFHERLLRPLALPVHDWRLTGLDAGRGMTAAEVSGPALTGRAAAPAAPLA